MKQLRRQITNVPLFLLFYLFVVPKKACAYLDPGSGSFIFQLLLGAMLGGLLTIKIYWRKIKNFLVSFFSKKEKKKAEE